MPQSKDYTPQEVIALCLTYMTIEHVNFVKKAYDLADKAHKGQMRKSGEEYIMHPVQVAGILAELKMDPVTVATGFLHDVVEDTEYTYNQLAEIFTPEVADLVDGVTKLGKIKFKSKQEHQAENHRKMLLAMAQDVRVILVKLADRVHNMRTLKHHRPEKQRDIAKETLDIYAPLADRLGINRIKWELEDTSLRYINPQQYYRIVHLMNARREDRERYIDDAKTAINKSVNELEIEAQITGRPKHIYSIYKKMKNQKKQFNEIYDLLAIRIIVNSIKDCYAVLGAIHTRWKPMPGRFKDYIAMPKANMYQSLHTTVLGPNATPLEVQIRTVKMHEIAEYGVAAHWAYKEGMTQKIDKDELSEHISWFRDILELQSESRDASDFMDSIKQDIFKDKVYVFSPKGDVMELPSESSTLDFAYHVHTEVGNKAMGAKVNGKIVPLNYKLKTGDIVEMLTSANSFGPSRDWLNYVNTSKAKNKIKRFFKTQEKEQNIDRGKEILEKILLEMEFNPKEILKKDKLKKTADRFNFQTIDDLYAGIGFGEVKSVTVVNHLTEKERRDREKETYQLDETTSNIELNNKSEPERMKIRHEGGVVIQGADNLLVRLSKCCNPVPGDKIVGYITRGRGVSIHRKDCPNLYSSDGNEERLIEVEWESTKDSKSKDYNAEVQVEGYDRSGFLNEILQVINSQTNKLSNINGRVDKNGTAIIKFTIAIQNLKELEQIVDKVKTVPDVYSVKRITT
ncbi:MAG: RelA/SpoT family protein [Alkalibacterium gilvum]|uniref:RelA/SpoT family protein n=1 Tax=Alkalibacterium TaxID=99906 RepID=UPI002647F9E5|nr:bifunctional (p)ppGpp synthetase/guanosine-3',5'-bis(diphosphate) 3'-pyrophosphohydrolase [Alkalibacterium sp.]MDN6293485.1 bifunctional (p)ppGpp synthetase/guanosine-3',5'-bis(diphosphate) 3'-pyrophosphohydrolase [Alkalibacterium sp.]MDN6295161.1 bifunctional (p)ppGpp synthetase/guanosine-3',5'-bis(diphosphate) 3'-pyrophosphohydrolase [Alkalibacterium sp.]MDN6728606.1 bifunctional (p)ppGpp synthetase/guanosine-3',5'-bis(diphosphate) 3'-pyrophosphohydrolase [Alkalibacterium sp.]